MDIEDAQREVRSVYVGGFWGQLISSVIWLVRGVRHVGNPKSIYSDCHRRRIFHLSAHANGATFVGSPRSGGQRKSAALARDASRVCAAVFHAASCARRPLPLELVFPGSDDPPRRTLFAVCFSLRDAHVPVPRGDSDRYGCHDCILVFG